MNTEAERARHTTDDPRLRRWLALARLALLWEALWPLAWPLPALAALFLALALFDILPLLPGWLHAVILAILVAAAGVVAWRLRRLARPTVAQARRRLERDSGLPHQPLQGLADRLAAGITDPVSRILWQTEQRRQAEALRRLTLRPPSPGVARRDPWGLRFAPLLLLAIAAAGGWHDVPSRLLRALTPHIGGAAGPPAILQVWITPPAYTHLAPSLLESLPAGQTLTVPAGSTLLAELQGGHGAAQLAIDDEVRPFESQGTDSQRLEATLTKGRQLSIRQGYRRLAAWRITVRADQPPTIAFSAPPDVDGEGRLRLAITAHDDYGVAKAWATIHRVDSPHGAPLILPLPLGGAHPTDVRQAAWHDLTGHPWAGLPVTIQPAAEDDAGQAATGPSIKLILPERRFTNPVARAIVAQRRRLATDPSQRPAVGDALAFIAGTPEAYGGDLLVFLALATARARLLHDQSADAVPSVLDILWQTALRIEEGDRPAAQRAVDQASRDLQKALAEGAPEAEIERLMNELQAAMAQYLDALAKQAQRQDLADLPGDPDQPSVTPQELDEMLDRLRELSRTGARQAAADMLAQMRQLLDGLQSGMSGGATGEQARQAGQAMQDLEKITRDQRALLDQTFRRTQGASGGSDDRQAAGQPDKGKQPGKGKQPAAGEGRNGAASQQALRNRLGQVMQTLGDLGADIPDALGQAEQAMRRSAGALQKGDMQSSVDAQGEAVTRLEEGARQAMRMLARRMGGMGRLSGAGRDPLGRPLHGPGTMDENNVRIPDHGDTQKAREVLDELRKRSGEADRPAAEREYLQRLLKSFY